MRVLAKTPWAIAAITVALVATSAAYADQSSTFRAHTSSEMATESVATAKPDLTYRFNRIKAVAEQFHLQMREQASTEGKPAVNRGRKMFKNALTQMDNS